MKPISTLTERQKELILHYHRQAEAASRQVRELLQMAAPEEDCRFDLETMAFYAVEQEEDSE